MEVSRAHRRQCEDGDVHTLTAAQNGVECLLVLTSPWLVCEFFITMLQALKLVTSLGQILHCLRNATVIQHQLPDPTRFNSNLTLTLQFFLSDK
jgi:hypothetical protein